MEEKLTTEAQRHRVFTEAREENEGEEFLPRIFEKQRLVTSAPTNAGKVLFRFPSHSRALAFIRGYEMSLLPFLLRVDSCPFVVIEL